MNKLNLARNHALMSEIISSCESLKNINSVINDVTDLAIEYREIILESMIISPDDLKSNIALSTLLQINQEFGLNTLYGLSLQVQWHWFVAYTTLNSRYTQMSNAMVRILCFSPSVGARIMAAYALLSNERDKYYDLVSSFSTDEVIDSQGNSLGDSIKAYIDDLNSLNAP